jgi:hypothetical protein
LVHEKKLEKTPKEPQEERAVFTPCSTLASALESLKVSNDHSESESSHHQTIKSPLLPAPQFDGTDFDTFLKRLCRFFRLSGMENAPDQTKKDWLVTMAVWKASRIVESLCEDPSMTFVSIVEKLAFSRSCTLNSPSEGSWRKSPPSHMVWTLRKSNFFFWNSKKSFQDSQVEQ